MSDVSRRFRTLSTGFTERVEAVAPAGWDSPAPCEGWVARDVVRHLVEWMPAFLATGSGIEIAPGPAVEDDPVEAWAAVRDGVQAALDDPLVASSTFSHPQAGEHTVEGAVAIFFLSDVLVHTWDLARAAGLDETLDPEEVGRFAAQTAAIDPATDDAMRRSGHFGPRVDVPDDADDQTRLLAFMGRRVTPGA
jgi:uncharacterized protein (TIGR03086 family)